MSQDIQRAIDSFAVIDGDFDERRGIAIAPDKILTSLHDLRRNKAFDIFLPAISDGIKDISTRRVDIISDEALDAAIIKLPGPVIDIYAATARGRSLNPFASRHLLSDAKGPVMSEAVTPNADTSKRLQTIFADSHIPLNARYFEVLKANARLDKKDSGMAVVNDNGEVQSIVTGVIDDPDKSLWRQARGLVGGKSNDFFAARQDAMAGFLHRNL